VSQITANFFESNFHNFFYERRSEVWVTKVTPALERFSIDELQSPRQTRLINGPQQEQTLHVNNLLNASIPELLMCHLERVSQLRETGSNISQNKCELDSI
jgi:hypothetical protein